MDPMKFEVPGILAIATMPATIAVTQVHIQQRPTSFRQLTRECPASAAARIVKCKSGVSDKRHVLHLVRKSVGPALGRESFGMHERVSDSFGRHKRIWHNAAEKFPFAEDANFTRYFASHQCGCRDKVQCRRITDTGIVLTRETIAFQ
jgi:hypothetical protein